MVATRFARHAALAIATRPDGGDPLRPATPRSRSPLDLDDGRHDHRLPAVGFAHPLADGAPHVSGWAAFTGLMAYGGVVGGGIAYWLAGVVTRRLPAGVTSLGLLGVPVVGTLASALILREPLGWDVWLALALIVGGIALGTVPGGQPTAATPCRTDRAP